MAEEGVRLPTRKGWSDYGMGERRSNGSELWVGYWQIGGHLGLAIFKTKKPFWLHRFMCKMVFGFEWRDGDWNQNED